MQLTRQLEKQCNNRMQSILFVVHNLKSFTTMESLEHQWSEVKNIYGEDGYETTHREVMVGSGKKEKIEYLCKPLRQGSTRGVTIWHFCMGAEGTEAGARNAAVIEFLKQSMAHPQVVSRHKDILTELEITMTNQIKSYLKTKTDLEAEPQTDIFIRKADDNRRLKLFTQPEEHKSRVSLRDWNLSRFVSVYQEERHSIQFRVIESNAARVRVEIDLPGLSQEAYKQNMQGDPQLHIAKGERCGDGVKITVRPWLVARITRQGDNIVQTARNDTSEAVITIDRKLKDWMDLKINKVEDGVLILEWLLQEDAQVNPFSVFSP